MSTMMTDNRARLRGILDQERIPVLIRTADAGLRIRLPFRATNRAWLKGERRANPKGDRVRRFWTVSNSFATRWGESAVACRLIRMR